MKATLTGAASLLDMESRDWVGWPLISLTPNISEDGKEAEMDTAREGEVEGFSTSSSTTYVQSDIDLTRLCLGKLTSACARRFRVQDDSRARLIRPMSTMIIAMTIGS